MRSKQTAAQPAAANRSPANASHARGRGTNSSRQIGKRRREGVRGRKGNRKERKTVVMGHRKQRTSFVSVVPHHLIRYNHLIRIPPHETTPSRPPSPSSHLHTSPHPRAAHHRSFRLPPRPPCRRAGRDNTASKQLRHLITNIRRHPPHLIRPLPHRPA